MGLLTIGAFAAATGLTPKALRLYDDLGLLPPAAVDPESGYRLYDPDQVHRARLVARLRGIGMSLAGIGAVLGLDPAAAAAAVTAYWGQVTADTAARARLAATLVAELTERTTTMTHPDLRVRYATRCETGAVRDSNEDAVYADDRLLAVADGMRGPGGAAASTTAIDAVVAVSRTDAPAADLLTALADAVAAADRTIRAAAAADGTIRAAATGDHHPVTTLTAVLRRGCHLALVHIGDTRAYLLRDGDLIRLTRDHTWVQSQVDAGRMGDREAMAHPQRALLARALGAGAPPVEADLALCTARVGDRYLLCSDGLSAVVAPDALHEALRAAADPGRAVDQLTELAQERGAPDNVACVVADIVAE